MPTMAEIMSGAVAPTTPGTSMSSYTPGLRDRISGWVQDAAEYLGASRGLGQHWGEGSRMALEGNPVTGPFFAANDTQEAISGGRYKDAAKSALGLVPLIAPEARVASAVADEAVVAPVMTKAVAPSGLPPSFPAYHSSPYEFDQFDFARKGSGEGTNSFGRGGYFAGNNEVANEYGRMFTEAGQPAHMYEVNVGHDPEHLLDWDKPLGSQSPHVQSVIKEIGGARKSQPILPWDRGQEIYGKQAWGISNDTASERLQQAGVPGIQYLDKGSRDAGTGTRNYVIFDPANVSITRRYPYGGGE